MLSNDVRKQNGQENGQQTSGGIQKRQQITADWYDTLQLRPAEILQF